MNDTRENTTTERRPHAPRFDHEDRGDTTAHDRSIGSLLKSLSRQSSTLVREEVALARTEFTEKLNVLRSSMVRMAIGAGLLIAGVLLIMAAVNRGLTALLTEPLGLDIAVWLSPLVLGIIVAIAAYALFRSATSDIKEEGIVPHQTVDTLKDDKDWAERRVRA